jgi:DNA-binding transcriptional LysR family regulator
MNLPSIDSLVCFEAAARLSSFREAAKVVCLTPAAVSQRIKQLEELIGVALFERSNRSVRLTDAGQALLPAARACIEAARTCVTGIHADRGPPSQEIIIGSTYEIGVSWVTPALDRLIDALPRVTAHLQLGPAPDVLARVKSKELDAAITSYPLDPGFAAIDLVEERYALVASPELLAKTPFAKPEDAEQHVLLDIRPALPKIRLADSPELRSRFDFSNVRWLGSTEAILYFARHGRGVAILPHYSNQNCRSCDVSPAVLAASRSAELLEPQRT